MLKYKKEYLGETCILLDFASQIDAQISKDILSLFYTLKNRLNFTERGIIDLTPAYTSIAIYFSSNSKLLENDSYLDELIKQQLSNLSYKLSSTTHIIPTTYNGEDLESLLELHNLQLRELIALHSTPSYLIAMLGFKPYFPYLIGLDDRLTTPRRSSPRVVTPKGSVAIGGKQTGIYSETSPGGWHIIGHTTFNDYHLFKPGDYIMFRETSNAN